MPDSRVLISAGEASGDMYGARLAAALAARTGASLFGMGGSRMRAAGVDLIADYHEIGVVGIAEVLRKIPTVIRVQNRLAREAVKRHAALAILIDSPGTHLGVARRLKNARVPVGYFIGPQIWAWRAGRVRIVRRRVKKMVVIFPFEEPLYRKAGVPVEFVGHPLVDVLKPTATRAEFAALHGLDPSRPIVALMPGSRPSEIALNYPGVVAACELLAQNSRIQFVHVTAPGLSPDLFLQHAQLKIPIHRIEGETYNALSAADCAIVASGTATIEAALLGTPMVVIYRVASLTAFFLRRMVRTPYYAMANLVAGRRVVPELMQDDFTPENVAREIRLLLDSEPARAEMKAGLADVRARLGPPGAIERAADIFAAMM
ncbi:MAG TPA: lipid-A-disaccharide synthase [Candidatus Acidoferrum sp.]|nr:lipid-A-disaccharide synthase [Candidatus Acidoferrum sp.]